MGKKAPPNGTSSVYVNHYVVGSLKVGTLAVPVADRGPSAATGSGKARTAGRKPSSINRTPSQRKK
jgi:hypothetical protein